jgi:uncharacterized membrane protein (UPF0182 family)
VAVVVMRSSMPRVIRRGKVTFAVIGVALLLLIFLNQLVDLWTDWLWFNEVGFSTVFSGVLRTKIWLFVLFGARRGRVHSAATSIWASGYAR